MLAFYPPGFHLVTRKKIYIKVLEFDIGEGRRPLHTNDLSCLLTKHQNQLYSSEAAQSFPSSLFLIALQYVWALRCIYILFAFMHDTTSCEIRMEIEHVFK